MPRSAKRESTLVIIKPDAIQRRLPTQIKRMVLDTGLDIKAAWQGLLRRVDMEYIYGPQHSGNSYYQALLRQMTFSEAELVLVAGENAVVRMLELKGSRNSNDTRTIRGRFATDEKVFPFEVEETLVHCSDRLSAKREVRYFIEIVPLLRRPSLETDFIAAQRPSDRSPRLRR